jgi:hypothetical protein
MECVQINGGRVEGDGRDGYRLLLPALARGYGDAQVQDYGGRTRRHYPWRPGTHLRLRAQFSHGEGALVGTAGFGFWNAPFGDPSARWPALPQAVWFFYASAPSDLPFAAEGVGRGWFAGTMDAGSGRALAIAPLAPLVVLGNRWTSFKKRVWPWVQRRLGISYRPLPHDMTAWHEYELVWQATGCRFVVDGEVVLATPHAPRGPLGFVCWVDNQFMRATADGRLGGGVLPTTAEQWLAVAGLQVGLAQKSGHNG